MAKKTKKTKEYRKPSQFNQTPAADPAAPIGAPAARSQSNAMILISAGLVTSVLLFVYYHGWALGQLADLANGLPMPDQRVLGFDLGQVNELRTAMSEEAIAQLAYVHRTVGLFFPLLFGFFSLLTFGQWVTHRGRRWMAWAAPLLFVVVDLWSNRAIDALFAANVDTGAVALASTLTITRWALLVITAVSLLLIGVRRFVHTFRQKYAEATQHK